MLLHAWSKLLLIVLDLSLVLAKLGLYLVPEVRQTYVIAMINKDNYDRLDLGENMCILNKGKTVTRKE